MLWFKWGFETGPDQSFTDSELNDGNVLDQQSWGLNPGSAIGAPLPLPVLEPAVSVRAPLHAGPGNAVARQVNAGDSAAPAVDNGTAVDVVTFDGGGTATTASELNSLITAADTQTAAGTVTIDISGLIALNTLPAVANGESLTIANNVGTVTELTAVPDIAAINLHSGVTLVISGSNNAVLDGGNTVRGLFAYAGNVTIENLTIQNTMAQGGAGSNAGFAGGGGAGLGGGLFVAANANVSLYSVAFSGNKAYGGAGGNNTGGSTADWGGGGGLGGNAGILFGGLYFSGGGGVGRTAFGGVGSGQAVVTNGTTDNTSVPGPGIIVGGAAGGNGAPIAGANDPHTAGARYGGGGGMSEGTGHNQSFPSPSHYYGAGAGGGGVGGHNGYSLLAPYNGQKTAGGGGHGGFGGGGGAGYYYGGAGGFGGGGGAGQYAYGGNGGFGGGGGGMPNTAGTLARGGFGAGNAGGGANIGNGRTPQYALSGGDSGGGGLGAGGAVFVQSGGVLSLGGAGSVAAGTILGGAGGVPTGSDSNGAGTSGTAGSAFGSGIFIQNDSTTVAQGVTFAPATGQTLTVSGVIEDEAGAGGVGTNDTEGKLLIQGGGTTRITATNTFDGGSTISAGSTLDLGAGGAAGAGGIGFAVGGGNVLLVENAALVGGHLTNVVSGFTAADVIDLSGLAFVAGATAIVSGSTLQVVSNGATDDVAVAGLTNGNSYKTQQDSGTGTEVVACFAAGTRIATPYGEVPVERLRVGDAVTTGGGETVAVKWIGRRGYGADMVAANPQLRPVRVRADALASGVPARDLLVSPSHALLVDGVLVPAAALVNGRSIASAASGAVAYFHIELDRHEILLANGAPAESFVPIAGRAMFQNASEFVAMYGPDAAPPATCRARIEDGVRLEAIRRRLAVRAGLPIPGAVQGPMRGHVERVTTTVGGMARDVEGWVLDESDPEQPVELEVIGAGAMPVRLLANRYRIDLDRAGLAGGRCGFSLRLPGRGRVTVRRASDGVRLPGAV